MQRHVRTLRSRSCKRKNLSTLDFSGRCLSLKKVDSQTRVNNVYYRTTLRDQYYEKAIDLYYREGYSVRRIAQIIPVSKSGIARWIANFAEDNPHKAPIMKKRFIQPAPQIEQGPRTDLPEDVKALQDEVLLH